MADGNIQLSTPKVWQRMFPLLGRWKLNVECSVFSQLLLRVPPDPVALVYVHSAVFFETHLPAVVGFIPADGVKDKQAIRGAPLVQRLAADDVVRQSGDELRCQCVKRIRIVPVRLAVALQRHGHPR